MYKNILECIENIQFDDASKKTILRENCLQHIFSWNCYEITYAEYYKRFKDWIELKKHQEMGKSIDAFLRKKMKSDFYKKEINAVTTADGDLNLLINKFTNDDVKIVMVMKTLNSQVWLTRFSSIWTNIITILSLIVAFISISISIQKSIQSKQK